MIYNSNGVPLRQVLLDVALAKSESAAKPVKDRPYRILKDKLGDAYRVFQSIWKETGYYDGAKLRAVRKTRDR